MKELIEKLKESERSLEADIEGCRASKGHDNQLRLMVLESRYLNNEAITNFIDALKECEANKPPYGTK